MALGSLPLAVAYRRSTGPRWTQRERDAVAFSLLRRDSGPPSPAPSRPVRSEDYAEIGAHVIGGGRAKGQQQKDSAVQTCCQAVKPAA